MTLIAWMLYTLLIGTLLALTARGFEEVCRIAARPSRWGWMGALVLTVVLAGLAPRRTTSLLRPVPAVPTHANAEAGNLASLSALSRTTDVSKVQPHSKPLAELQSTIAAAWPHIPPSVNRYLAVLWGSFSTLALLLLATVYLRFRRVRRGWPVAELQGVRVRIAVDGGPAVVGLMQPEIIIPQWLLGRSHEEQRIVLAHEREHLRARDPLVLAAGCFAAVLLPWHPAVWWMLARLRLAVELDCDMRVLRQGVAPRLYGAVLIDMAERCSGFPIAAPAMADKASHLQQRLFAMKPLRLRFARARGSIVGAFAFLCLLAACAARVPVIAAQVPAGDAGAARSTPDNTARVRLKAHRERHDTMDNITTINADSVLQAVPIRSPTDARVRLKAQQERHDTMNNITTINADSVLQAVPIRSPTDVTEYRATGVTVQRTTGTPDDPSRLRLQGVGAVRGNDPIVIVDGVRFYTDSASPSPLDHLEPNNIQSIEVLKGPSAVTLYGPDAADGVIVITTKKKPD